MTCLKEVLAAGLVLVSLQAAAVPVEPINARLSVRAVDPERLKVACADELTKRSTADKAILSYKMMVDILDDTRFQCIVDGGVRTGKAGIITPQNYIVNYSTVDSSDIRVESFDPAVFKGTQAFKKVEIRSAKVKNDVVTVEYSMEYVGGVKRQCISQMTYVAFRPTENVDGAAFKLSPKDQKCK